MVQNTKDIKYRLRLQKIKARETPVEEAVEVVLTVETNVPADLAVDAEMVIAAEEETPTEEDSEGVTKDLIEEDSKEKVILTEAPVTAADAEEEIHTKTYTTE